MTERCFILRVRIHKLFKSDQHEANERGGSYENENRSTDDQLTIYRLDERENKLMSNG